MQFVFISVISLSKNGVVCAGKSCSMVWDCTVGCGFAEGFWSVGLSEESQALLCWGSLKQLSGLKTSNWKKKPKPNHKISGRMDIQVPLSKRGSAPSKWRNNCCHSVMEFLPFPRVSVPYFTALASSEIVLMFSSNPPTAQLSPQCFVLPPVHIKTNFFPFCLHLKAVHESSVAWCYSPVPTYPISSHQVKNCPHCLY